MNEPVAALSLFISYSHRDQGCARVVPVILWPCDWQTSPLGRLQALPQDGVPVVSHADIDVALPAVVQRLRALADDLRGSPQATAPDARVAQGAGRPSVAKSPPPRPLSARTGVRVGLSLAGLLAATWAAYTLTVKPPLAEARAQRRRVEYSQAQHTLQALPAAVRALPWLAVADASAGFGAQLAAGAHIRTLAPALAQLPQCFPDAADVLVFAGLKSCWVDNDAHQALASFSRAAWVDPAHVEAHALAMARHIDLAYAAMARADFAQAHSAAARPVAAKPDDAGATEGWVFRLAATELLDVRGAPDKHCLLAWAAAVSRSLQAAVEGWAPSVTPPQACGDDAAAARLRAGPGSPSP